MNQVVHTYIQLHMNGVFAEILSEKPAVRVLFNKWRLPDKVQKQLLTYFAQTALSWIHIYRAHYY